MSLKSIWVLDQETPVTATPASFTEATSHVKHRFPDLAELIDQTPCFAKLWKDEAGVCPETGCDIRLQCQNAWEEAQVLVQIKPAQTHSVSPPVVKKKRRKRVVTIKTVEEKKRGKWKGSGKYQRLGYQSADRPVDRMLTLFLDAMGNPNKLPQYWSYKGFTEKYKQLGRLVLSQTASYTSVIVDGHSILRFWTNAGNCAIIDIVPELAKAVSSIKGMPALTEIPEGVRAKSKPCTHRFELTFRYPVCEGILKTIGAMLQMAYRNTQ